MVNNLSNVPIANCSAGSALQNVNFAQVVIDRRNTVKLTPPANPVVEGSMPSRPSEGHNRHTGNYYLPFLF